MSCTNIFCKSLFHDVDRVTASSQDPESPLPTKDDLESIGCCDPDSEFKTETQEGGVTDQWVMFDFGVSLPDGNRFIFSGMNLSSAADVCIQGNETNNFDESTPSFEQSVSVDQSGFITFTIPPGNCYRYWRLLVKCDPLINCVKFGVSYFGDGFPLNRGNINFPVNITEIDRSQVLFTESGRAITDVRPKAQQISFEFTALDDKDVKDLKCLWKTMCLSKCFLLELDPDLCFSCETADMTFLVRFNTPPSCSLVSFKKYTMTFDLLGLKEWQHGACT